MKAKVLLLIIMAFVIFTLALYAVGTAKTETKPMAKATTAKVYTGYLCDVHCGTAGMDPAKNDLTKYPNKHTVGCMKMQPCMDSGYGMLIKNSKGIYTFHKFDSKGSDIAKAAIMKLSSKTDDVKIIVKGTMQPNGNIMVATFSFPKALAKAKQVNK